MSFVVVRRAAALGLGLVLLVAGSALADTLTADGDALVAGNQTSVNLGEVAPGSSHGLDVGFALLCKNGTHLTAGATIAIVAADGGLSVPNGGSLVLTPGSVTVPAQWPETGTYCSGDEATAVITPAHIALTAPDTEGTGYTFDVLFALAGDEFVSNTVGFTVVLDVVAAPPPPPADDTAPAIDNMPDDITVTTPGSDAVVSWTGPTAIDDTDPTPSVACVPASGSTFALGTTTVTCTARDASGNHASESFTVTVSKAPPPAPVYSGSWQRPLAAAVPALVGHAGRTVPLKVVINAGVAAQGPGDIADPTLRVERLATCAADAAATASSPGGTFAWADGAWHLNLATSALGTGCVRVTAMVDGAAAASAVIQLVPDPATSKPKK